MARPLSIMIQSFGTSILNGSELLQIVNDNFDLRPGRIIKYTFLPFEYFLLINNRQFRDLNLKRPIYEKTAENGHFGNKDFPWEQPKQLIISPELMKRLKLDPHVSTGNII